MNVSPTSGIPSSMRYANRPSGTQPVLGFIGRTLQSIGHRHSPRLGPLRRHPRPLVGLG